MSHYRVLVDQAQKNGTVVQEWQNVAIEDGEEVPAGAVALPADACPDVGEPVPYEIVGGVAVPDLALVKRAAAERVEQKQEAAFRRMNNLAVSVAITEIWADIKRLERDNAAGKVPAFAAERAETYPFLSALAHVEGVGLAVAAANAKPELKEHMRRIALFAARALIAKRSIRNGATVAAIRAAAEVDLEA